jgi:molybdopterin molybdotransferase
MVKKEPDHICGTAILEGEYTKGSLLTHFLKSKIDGEKVRLLHAQESYRLHSFAQADCLVELKEGQEQFQSGETVPVHLLRFEL